jgi:DNA helicase-2/ATP-dependent DNA helicase PcrA
LRAIYARASEARQTFAEALLEAHAEGFEEAPAASRNRALEAVDRTLAWLDGIDLPETLEDGRWGSWISETFADDPPGEFTGELLELLIDVDDAVEGELPFGRYVGLVHPFGKDLARAQTGGVRFMSMSMSKGLTVTATIVVGAEDGVIPRPDADLAEERRLLYVAMTRARRFQYVTCATRRTGPTARAGASRVQARRNVSRFLRHGPIGNQGGEAFLDRRW